MPKSLPISLALLLAAGCGGKGDGAAASPLPLVGKVDQASFASPVSSVRAQRPGAPDVAAAVATDGTFALALRAGRGYHLDFLTDSQAARLVLPRQGGALRFGFDVAGGGKAFDLGAVRYIGDPKAQTFTVTKVVLRSTATSADPPGAAEVECEDGHDASGAVCIDDQDGPMCEGHGGSDEGNAGGADGKDDDDGATNEAAVAEHNVPASVGCAGEGDKEGDDKEGDDKEGDEPEGK